MVASSFTDLKMQLCDERIETSRMVPGRAKSCKTSSSVLKRAAFSTARNDLLPIIARA